MTTNPNQHHYVILGLGNPDREGTRHNIGKDMVTALSALCKAPLKNTEHRCRYSDPLSITQIPLELLHSIFISTNTNINANTLVSQGSFTDINEERVELLKNDQLNAFLLHAKRLQLNPSQPTKILPNTQPSQTPPLISTSIPDIKITFAVTMTYMNESGKGVLPLIEALGIPIQNLIITHDDFDVPLGGIQLRNKGTSGGHNGVGDIIDRLQKREKERVKKDKQVEKRSKSMSVEEKNNLETNNHHHKPLRGGEEDIKLVNQERDISTIESSSAQPSDDGLNDMDPTGFIRMRLGIGRPGENHEPVPPLLDNVATINSNDRSSMDTTSGDNQLPQQPQKKPKNYIPPQVMRPKVTMREVEQFVLGPFTPTEKVKLFPTHRLFLTVLLHVIIYGMEKAHNNAYVLTKFLQQQQQQQKKK